MVRFEFMPLADYQVLLADVVSTDQFQSHGIIHGRYDPKGGANPLSERFETKGTE